MYDLNLRDNEGKTPFYCAVYDNYKNMMKVLIEANADINIADK